MNKPKSQRLDLTSMTGEEIAQLILFGKYTKSALWAFISRNGGADAVHAKHPQIAVCLHILKQERKKAKQARAFKTILKPKVRQLPDVCISLKPLPASANGLLTSTDNR